VLYTKAHGPKQTRIPAAITIPWRIEKGAPALRSVICPP